MSSENSSWRACGIAVQTLQKHPSPRAEVRVDRERKNVKSGIAVETAVEIAVGTEVATAVETAAEAAVEAVAGDAGVRTTVTEKKNAGEKTIHK